MYVKVLPVKEAEANGNSRRGSLSIIRKVFSRFSMIRVGPFATNFYN